MNIPRVRIIDDHGIETWAGSLRVFARQRNVIGPDLAALCGLLRAEGSAKLAVGGAAPAFTVALV